jgi:spore maturation protein B
MTDISSLLLPIILLSFVVFAIFRKVNVFDEFLIGATDGINTVIKIFPSILGLMVSVSMLKACGILDLLSDFLGGFASVIGLPKEVLPIALLRPVSGSGGIALLKNILDVQGPDSVAGRVASVIAGATETTFYTIAVYYGAVGIKKTRYTAIASMSADFMGIVASGIAVKLFFS